jgi:protein phosphatase
MERPPILTPHHPSIPNKPTHKNSVVVSGPGPSARYAHTLALVANRFLVAAGGNDGSRTLADAWALDTSDKPYQWRRIEATGPVQPPARMYATAAARPDGLLLLCGGRDGAGVPLDDAYGLARHRDGRWEWAAAPGTMPAPRYQHGAVFVGARLHVSGGALGGGRVVEADTGVAVLDTAAGAWCAPPPLEGADAEVPAGDAAATSSAEGGEPAAADGGEGTAGGAAATPPLVLLARRCRHAVASVGPFVFMYGGLRGSTLLGDMLLADDSGTGAELTACDPRAPAW